MKALLFAVTLLISCGVAFGQSITTKFMIEIEVFPLEESVREYRNLMSECELMEEDAAAHRCLSAVYEVAETKLTAAYKRALDTLKAVGESDQPLRSAERAWITFRDANCALRTSDIQPKRNALLACLIAAAVLRKFELSQIGD